MLMRVVRFILIAGALTALARAGTLYFGQSRLIYHPKPYTSRPSTPETLTIHDLDLPGGNGKAFVVRSAGSEPLSPKPLWIFFNGNASVALGWLDVVRKWPVQGKVLLLVDYPGYGYMAGEPSRTAIAESVEAAYAAAARYLGEENFFLEGVVGYSLGAAVALDFVVKQPPQRLVLLAPFTSLLDMACLRVGRPFCYLLIDRFDNAARLKELSESGKMPQTLIVHGTSDTVVPVDMSRRLHQQFSAFTAYREVPGGDHGSILHSEIESIAELLK